MGIHSQYFESHFSNDTSPQDLQYWKTKCPLHYLISTNKEPQFTEMVKKMSKEEIHCALYDTDYESNSLLFLAFESHNKQFLTILCTYVDIDINKPCVGNGLFNYPPLFHAIKMGNFNLINLFLNDGVNLHIQDRKGFTPLLFAINECKNASRKEKIIYNKIINLILDALITNFSFQYKKPKDLSIDHLKTHYKKALLRYAGINEEIQLVKPNSFLDSFKSYFDNFNKSNLQLAQEEAYRLLEEREAFNYHGATEEEIAYIFDNVTYSQIIKPYFISTSSDYKDNSKAYLFSSFWTKEYRKKVYANEVNHKQTEIDNEDIEIQNMKLVKESRKNLTVSI